MALLPGGTESEFAKVATEKSEKLTQKYKELEPDKGSGLLMPTSHEVAMKCLSAFEKKQFIISGNGNRLLFATTKFLSRKGALNMAGKMFKRIAGE